MNIVDLPPDVIYTICERLGTKELSKLMTTHSRIHKICFDIMQNRLEKRKKVIAGPTIESWIDKPEEKGTYHIEIQNNGVKIEVVYEIIGGLYLKFIETGYALSIHVPPDQILNFLEFLRGLSIGFGKHTFNELTIFIGFTTATISDLAYTAVYEINDFILAIDEVIKFINIRYHNLLLGINTEYINE